METAEFDRQGREILAAMSGLGIGSQQSKGVCHFV